MIAPKQAAWLFICLILLAYSGWYFAASGPKNQLDEHSLEHSADTIIEKITLKQFNEQGQLVSQLTSPLIEHIPHNNTHHIKTPLILFTHDNEAPWQIEAQNATSLHGGKKINFYNNVRIHQAADKEHAESTFHTEEISYYPFKKIAITDKEVTFIQPNTTVKAKGMKANLADNHIQLLQRARGLHVPSEKG